MKTYINALLKSHPGREVPVLSTGWAHQHPLLERVQGLRLRRRPGWQRRLGQGAALGLCLGLTVLAQAAQPVSGAEVTEQLMQFLSKEEAISGTKPIGLVVQMDSQQGQQGWRHKDMAFAFDHSLNDTYSQFHLTAPMGDWCLGVHLYRFPGGEIRPQSEVMDSQCRKTLTELQPVQPGKGPTSLQAQLPGTPAQAVQAQVSLHFEDPRSESFIALFKRQSEEMPAEQRMQMAQRMAERSRDRAHHDAQDKAWRLARGEQP